MPKNKEKQIGFRLAADERAIIERQAKKLDLRLSDYVRLCVLADVAARQKGKQP